MAAISALRRHSVRLRWAAPALVLIAAATGPAAAFPAWFSAHADLDANPGTGCTVPTLDGDFFGVEIAVRTTVETSYPPQVTGVERLVCSDGSLVTDPTFVPTPPLQWPVGVGIGTGGCEVIETYLTLPSSPRSPVLRLGFDSNGGFEIADALLTVDGGAGPPILVPWASPLEIPTVGEVGILALAALLTAAALLRLRRSQAGLRVAALLLGFALAAVAWAAITRDGAIGDWAGSAPAATDPLDDADQPANLCSVHAVVEGNVLQLRIDADLGSTGIHLEKLTNGQDADTPPAPTILVGSPVQWKYVVTNAGDVALSSVSVSDDEGVAVSCPKTVLQPGESMVCTANGTATAGQYSNLGSAVGTPPNAPDVSDSDPSHYFGQ